MNQNTTTLFARPVAGDYDPYYLTYISLVPEDVDVATLLHTQREWFGDFIESISPELARYAYAPGKWSLAEMIGHVLDTERVFAYRMLAISRDDKSHFPGFEQDDYVRASIYGEINPMDLAAEWRAIRSSTIYLTRHMDAAMASRMGTANNRQIRASVIPYLMAGHVIHHHRIAQERYLINS